jgi:gliding motility-associated-like protein
MNHMFLSRTALFTILLTIGSLLTRAQSAGTLQFIENKGQWNKSVLFSADMQESGFYLNANGYTVLNRQVLNRAGKPTTTPLYAHAWSQGKGQLTPVPTTAGKEPNDSMTVKTYVYGVQFLGASAGVQVMPDKPTGGYNNYFLGNDRSTWASHCRTFQAVLYKDMYPGIDVRYYSDAGQLKYNLIVHPNADLSRVRLQYVAATSVYVKNNQLHVGSPLGENVEQVPESYQPSDSGRTSVDMHYKVKGNIVTFNPGSYDHNTTLVIDPTFKFCSFTGSKGDNWGFTATYGADGSMYLGGISQNGFLTTPNAYQPGFQGTTVQSAYPPDVAIIKLTPDGTKEDWATYLGGHDDDELPTSMIENHNGELIVVGHTRSADFPSYESIGDRGGWDIFVSRFSNDGSQLLGSMVLGGSGQDGSNITDQYEQPVGAQSLKQNYGDDSRSEVIVDANDNIYVASCTRSSGAPTAGGFPTLNGFQMSNANPATQDGVVFKVNAVDNALIWSTLIGGTDNDAAYVLDISPITGQLFVAGGTASGNFPGVPASGVVQPAYGGAIDGFIAWLQDNGNSVTLVKSTYIGTGAVDQIYGLMFDRLGFPYITGTTLSASWPIINAPYNVPTAKQFICKLQPDLSAYIYSTTWGTASAAGAGPNISPVAFLVDRCENIYVSGWGGVVDHGNGYPSSGTAGLPITANPAQSTTDGSDFYFFVMQKNATGQLYGSFFGQKGGAFQEHVDGGTSRFDQNGVIYQGICANCYGGAVFPTKPANVFAFTNGTLAPGTVGGCNEAGVKIAFNLAGVGSGVKASISGKTFSNLGCIPLLVNFTDTIGNAVTYLWHFGDGSPDVTTTTPATSHTYTNTGVYQIRLISIDPTSCNGQDTSYTVIRAADDSAHVAFTDFKIPPCTDLTYQFNNTSAPAPGANPFTDTSFTWKFGDNTPAIRAGLQSETHPYAAPGVYTVQLILTDTNYCNAPDTAQVNLHVAANVKAQFTGPTEGCAPDSVQFVDESVGGMQWNWTFGDGSSSTVESPGHYYPNAGTYQIKLIVTDTSTCNKKDSAFSTITLQAKPTAGFTWGPNPPITNTPTVFNNTSSIDAVSFKWLFGDGDTLNTTSRDTVVHQYNTTSTFNACLIAFNANGCSDTVCQVVSAEVAPDLDVPNAFTPGRFGVNAVIKVKGFAIAKMDWKIYNRWGQLVFESSSPDDGWNGNYRGVLQPMDVYAYTLSVEYTDGTKARKTGDITLLR